MKEFLQQNVPDYVRELTPYQPGKPIEEVERELGIKKALKMASNENPAGPSPKAVAAIKKAATGLNFYPDGGCFYLVQKMAQKLGVNENELLFGTGSSEIIELLMKCLLKPGDNIVVSEYAFLMYDIVAKGLGGNVRTAPARGYGHDLREMAKLVTKRTRLVFVANPNNPTGTYVDKNQLTELLETVTDIPVVLDEAYLEYVEARDYPDTMELRKQYPNLFIMRTFSKAYGLAGIRLGFGLGDPELIDYMHRIRAPFNVTATAQAAALAALDDEEHIEKSVRMNKRGKRQLYKALEEMNVEFMPTEANFILIKVGNGGKVFQDMLQQGIIVRNMEGYGLPDCIRVTIGRKDENERFIKSLKQALENTEA